MREHDVSGVPLRVLSYNVHGLRDDRAALTGLVRDLDPDVVIMQEAPRRFRWRHRCAALADDLDMVVAVGGLPSLGNLLLVSLRVRVHETWCLRYPLTPGRHLRGAAFARCSVRGGRFTVAGSHLATDAGERPVQASILRRVLGEVSEPLLVGRLDRQHVVLRVHRFIERPLLDRLQLELQPRALNALPE